MWGRLAACGGFATRLPISLQPPRAGRSGCGHAPLRGRLATAADPSLAPNQSPDLTRQAPNQAKIPQSPYPRVCVCTSTSRRTQPSGTTRSPGGPSPATPPLPTVRNLRIVRIDGSSTDDRSGNPGVLEAIEAAAVSQRTRKPVRSSVGPAESARSDGHWKEGAGVAARE
jgi:hypothetical protein